MITEMDFNVFYENLLLSIETEQKSNDDNDKSPADLFLEEILKNYLFDVLRFEESPEYYSDSRLSASYHSEDWEELNLFIADYCGRNIDFCEEYPTSNSIIKRFEQTVYVLDKALSGDLSKIEEAGPLFELLKIISNHKDEIHTISLHLVTDTQSNIILPKSETRGKYLFEYHVWTIGEILKVYESLNDAQNENIDEHLVIDLKEEYNTAITCLPADFKTENIEYNSYLAIVPGILLARLYDDYHEKLLQGNVRVFLQAKRGTNLEIYKSLNNPLERTRFFAYNNGLSATAMKAEIINDKESGRFLITKLEDFQIVNGGQTTASIHNAMVKKGKNILDGVYVQMKLTVPVIGYEDRVKELIPQIAKYSNSQKAISSSDFYSNDTFFRTLENLSRKIVNPDGKTYWFYERMSGQYSEEQRMAILHKSSNNDEYNQFIEKYPLNHRINKADVGVLFNAWHGYPYKAADGGQKNFKHYYASLKKIGNGRVPEINDGEIYYKEIVALSLLFKRMDKLVVQIKKESGAKSVPKKQIVLYSIALLSYMTKDRLDLIKIWESQNNTSFNLPINLESYIRDLLKMVWDFFINYNPRGSIVSEWTKSSLCWDRLCQYINDEMITFPKSLDSYILLEDEAKRRKDKLYLINPLPEMDESNDDNVLSDLSEENDKQTESNDDKVLSGLSEENDKQTESDKLKMIIPDDTSGFFEKSKMIVLSKFISEIEGSEILSDDEISVLKRINSIRRKHKIIDPKLLKNANNILIRLKSLISDDKNDDECDADIKSVGDKNDEDIFIYKTARADGRMVIRDGKYVVLKDSLISYNETNAFPSFPKKMKSDLIKSGNLIKSETRQEYILNTDVPFVSSSQAASFVAGNSSSGNACWKLGNITLLEYEQSHK